MKQVNYPTLCAALLRYAMTLCAIVIVAFILISFDVEDVTWNFMSDHKITRHDDWQIVYNIFYKKAAIGLGFILGGCAAIYNGLKRTDYDKMSLKKSYVATIGAMFMAAIALFLPIYISNLIWCFDIYDGEIGLNQFFRVMGDSVPLLGFIFLISGYTAGLIVILRHTINKKDSWKSFGMYTGGIALTSFISYTIMFTYGWRW